MCPAPFPPISKAQAQNCLVLGLVLRGHHLGFLNNFTFELVLCPMEQWTICVSRRDKSDMPFGMLHEHRGLPLWLS